jgi:hypothetical protein
MFKFLTLNRSVLFFILTVPLAVTYFYPFQSVIGYTIWYFVAHTIIFLWLWMLDVAMTRRIQPRIRPKNQIFHINLIVTYSIYNIPLLFTLFGYSGEGHYYYYVSGINAIPLMILALYLCFAFFAIFSHMAKILTYAEKKDPVDFTDRVGELFSFLFFFIGIWWLQPRIKKVLGNPEIPITKYVPFRN